ncbi:carbonic anhydrase [Zopfochytrium polystomum]|nr:carbonic anhydrase [Zopfochytrium polystomum]
MGIFGRSFSNKHNHHHAVDHKAETGSIDSGHHSIGSSNDGNAHHSNGETYTSKKSPTPRSRSVDPAHSRPSLLRFNHSATAKAAVVNHPAASANAGAHEPVDPTHGDSLIELLDRNRKWADQMKEENPGLFEKLSRAQNPDILWIGCSDSRVPAEEICGLGPGDLFVHRNIANVVVSTDMSMLSVLQYAVEVLKVRHIIVCGHYQCGGCLTAMSNKQYGLIDNWLRNIKDVYQSNREQLEDVCDSDRGDLLVELNVAKSVHNVCHTGIVQNAWDRGQALSIHGWVYRISDGRINDLKLCINKQDEVENIYSYVSKTSLKKELEIRRSQLDLKGVNGHQRGESKAPAEAQAVAA